MFTFVRLTMPGVFGAFLTTWVIHGQRVFLAVALVAMFMLMACIGQEARDA